MGYNPSYWAKIFIKTNSVSRQQRTRIIVRNNFELWSCLTLFRFRRMAEKLEVKVSRKQKPFHLSQRHSNWNCTSIRSAYSRFENGIVFIFLSPRIDPIHMNFLLINSGRGTPLELASICEKEWLHFRYDKNETISYYARAQ